jgi:DNA helicase-2/ATP-dependent DNA helicase PcrA
MDFQERGLTDFLQNLALVSDQDTIAEAEAEGQQQGSVTLLTLHAAKGLEFKQVFIIGLDEGILPHSRSKDDPEEMAEERRLFYVGITRARDQLYLVRAERRTTFGDFEYCEPSRFLENIDEKVLSVQGRSGASRRQSRQDDFTWGSFSQPVSSRRVAFSSTNYQAKEPTFKPGMRVRNANWGEGLVLESKIDVDGEETVDIHFESVGFKRVIASLAGLEVVK